MVDSSCIVAAGLTYTVDGHTLLEGVTFRIAAGEYVGIIGPNGGGKTTLIKLLLGLLKPTQGEVRVFGKSPDSGSVRRRIGYVPQRVGQLERQFPATVGEIVASGNTAGMKSTGAQAVQRALELVGVANLRDRVIGTLSGGERQRVFIARALVAQPEVLILDEPTAGVDVGAQESFYDLLARLNTEHKLTVIFVTHDVDFIAHAANKVICLNRRLVCFGAPHAVLQSGELVEALYGPKAHHYHHHERV